MSTKRSEMSKIYLASTSPRRVELLRSLGLEFSVLPVEVSESYSTEESPRLYVQRMARQKALQGAEGLTEGLVIAADTVVVIDDTVLGKPQTRDDAARMLRLLQGRVHRVISGVALYCARTQRCLADAEETEVKFAAMTAEEIQWYISTGEPLDKAGAYAVQGKGAVFVEWVRGSYSNVVGLPLRLLYLLAKQLGYPLTTAK